ncbi:MAG: PaaI family thioesterase [Alphaproteobacteria bacterium]|nr:PaaI family thioesterase [Alphaproteobacteria bacterium]MDP6873068.1 PaaI family thioesterase [Alphaproteobacteria bacterium]
MPSEASSYNQPPSLRVENIERGIGCASATFKAGAEHLNMKGMLHGGIIAGLMDTIMAIGAGSHPDPAQRQFSITLSLSLNFVGSAGDETLYLRSETTGGGKRTSFLEARIENADGAPIATAQGAFKLMPPGSEQPQQS